MEGFSTLDQAQCDQVVDFGDKRASTFGLRLGEIVIGLEVGVGEARPVRCIGDFDLLFLLLLFG